MRAGRPQFTFAIDAADGRFAAAVLSAIKALSMQQHKEGT
jgi:hypothetical protein